MPPARSSTTAAASKRQPASKARQNKTPLENNDTTDQQEVRTTRKKRAMNEASMDAQEESNLPDDHDKAKGSGGPSKRQRRSASPMPPPATKKRVPTNTHPGLIGKKKRRNKAEMAADKEKKEADAAIAAAVDEKTLTRLAEIELEQANAEKMRLEEIIRQRSKQPAAAPNTTDLEASQEDGTLLVDHSAGMDVNSYEDLSHLMDAVDSDDSDGDSGDDDDLNDDSETEIEATKKKPANKKRALLAKVAAKKKEVQSKKSGGKKKHAAASGPLASGLKPTWKSKAIADEGSAIGGLTDEHASGKRPKFQRQHQSLKVVGEVSEDSEADSEPEALPKGKKNTRRNVQGTTKAASEAPTSEDNSKLRTLKLKKVIVPKASGAAPSNKPAPGPSIPAQLLSAIGSAKSFKELPSPYNNAAKIKQYRMTCYSGWTASSEMFDGFTVDSKILLDIVQASFAATWPDSPYVPKQQDIFHQTIYNNLQTNRSIIAQTAIQMVETFVSEMSKDEIASWVTHVIKVRLGELVYSDPCPRGYSIVKGHENYKKPKGLLMTDFVVNLAETHLKNLSKSLIEHGHPRGLMALILVALERAARAFETGEFVRPSAFNRDHNGLLIEYLKSIDKFSHWDKFYEECGISEKGKTPKRRKSNVADMSLVEIGRGDLNFSSSPVKE